MGVRLLLAFGLALSAASKGNVVNTPLGSLEGVERVSRDGRSYTAWTSVPYAKPPIGRLRLANPEPVEKWEGVLKATGPGPHCWQGDLKGLPRPFEGQEDCLYLNVYRPVVEKKNLPILFYVHGGGFVMGYPGTAEMADYIMDKDVILVTITYRLGALGFMSLSNEELPGNFGMKDQALALKWVRDNIAAFGGDPASITVFGESAGGASAHYLLLSPATRDMVKGALVSSGTVNKAWSRVNANFLKTMTARVIEQVNCTKATAAKSVDCLRQIENPQLIVHAVEAVKPQGIDILFGPSVEPEAPGAFATTDLTEATSTKPLIISFTAGEYLLAEIPTKLHGEEKVKNAAQNLDAYVQGLLSGLFSDEDQLKSAAAKLKARYLKHDENSIPELIHDVSMVFQDMAFVHPALDLAETHKGPKWVYQLVHRGELSLFDTVVRMNTSVACHGDEILILFNQRSKFENAKEEPEPNDVRVSKEMIQYLTNFAAYGNPTPEGSPMIWPPYRGNEILRIKSEGSEIGDEDFMQEQKDVLHFWNQLGSLSTTKEEL